MCGLVYCKDFNKKKSRKGVNFKVMELYKKQRIRGHEGFGYYAPESDRFVHNVDEHRILRLLSRERQDKEIFFHHRNPTSTSNVQRSAHPFSTKPLTGKQLKHTFIGAHNGVLYNERALKLEHDKLGIGYISLVDGSSKFNDSEALIYELALYIEGKKPTMDAAGSMAWIIMELDDNHKPYKLHFGRNTNPLKMHHKKGKFLVLTSAGPGVDIIAGQHYTMDYATQQITHSAMAMNSSVTSTWKPESKEHNYELPAPISSNSVLAGHRYQNGYYTQTGDWKPLVNPPLPTTSTAGNDGYTRTSSGIITGTKRNVPKQTTSALSLLERSEYSRVIPWDNILAMLEGLLEEAEYDRDIVESLLKGKASKQQQAVMVSKMKLEGLGPLFLQSNDFKNLDERLWGESIDLYIYEQALNALESMEDAELLELWARQEQEMEVAL